MLHQLFMTNKYMPKLQLWLFCFTFRKMGLTICAKTFYENGSWARPMDLQRGLHPRWGWIPRTSPVVCFPRVLHVTPNGWIQWGRVDLLSLFRTPFSLASDVLLSYPHHQAESLHTFFHFLIDSHRKFLSKLWLLKTDSNSAIHFLHFILYYTTLASWLFSVPS